MANLSQDDRQTVPEDQGSRGLVHRVLDLGIGGLGLGIYALQGDLPSWNGLGPSGPASQAEEAATSPSHEEETAGTGPVINLMVGAASTTASAIGMGVSAAGKVTKGVWRVTAPLRWPLEALGITDMAERTAEVVAEIGRMELQHGTSFALGLVADTIDSIVAYLAHSPAVDALIESQVDKIIPMLA